MLIATIVFCSMLFNAPDDCNEMWTFELYDQLEKKDCNGHIACANLDYHIIRLQKINFTVTILAHELRHLMCYNDFNPEYCDSPHFYHKKTFFENGCTIFVNKTRIGSSCY